MTFTPDPEDNRENPKGWYETRDRKDLEEIASMMTELQRKTNDLSYLTDWMKTNSRDKEIAKAALEVNRSAQEFIKKMMYQRKMVEGMIGKIDAGRYGDDEE